MDEHLKIFLTVAETLNLTSAGKRLGLSKSQVSRKLSQLEQRVHNELILRTPQQVNLTEAGQDFLHYCQQIEASWEQALEKLQQQQQSPTGTIRISMPVSLGENILLPSLLKFARTYPEIKFEFDMNNSTRNLLATDVDIAFRYAKTLPDADLKVVKLFSIEHVLSASPNYLSHHPTIKSLDDLQRHSCISNDTDKWQFIVAGKTQNFQPKKRFSVNNYQTQKQITLAGMGISFLPKMLIAKKLAAGKLQHVLPEINSSKSTLWLLHAFQQQVPKRLRLLIDHLKEEFKTNPP